MKVLRRFLTAASYVTWLPLARRLGTGEGLALDRTKDLIQDENQAHLATASPPDSSTPPSGDSLAIPSVNSSDNSPSKLESDLSGLAKYLPSVGLLIGAFLVALALACLLFFKASNILTGAILVVAWLCATGGLHFDGLMDTADGVFSHRSKERMLEIMRDPRVGNFGVMTGFSIFILKLSALVSLCEHPPLLIPALVLAPAWARWSELYAIAMFPYARPEGNGKVWHDTTKTPADLATGAALPLIASLALAYQYGAINSFSIIIFACTVGMVASHWLAEQLGGQTGDTYGAVVEISETGCLVLMALVASQLSIV